MMIETLTPVTVRLGGQVRPLKAGAVLTLSQSQGWKLRAKAGEKVRLVPDGPCFACQSTRRWVSIHGAVVCPTCHPPTSPGLVKQWIGGRSEIAGVSPART